MKSTADLLHEALRPRTSRIVPELAAWLRAGPGLPHLRALLQPELFVVCRSVVRELLAWLGEPREEAYWWVWERLSAGADTDTPEHGRRAAELARSFFLEFLKDEGLLAGLPRRRRNEVTLLLDSFFGLRSGRPRARGPFDVETRARGLRLGNNAGTGSA